ncbi:CYTH domain-containing protein [Lactobacillus melliventris]|uniref:Adenylate cyclase family n=1 Tax=Lactobacillus melliventris TaxID=1218507 RepID=A0A0F4LES1_9LACO|nr:CYTH domain-containing protein [Lactobacillus melliventris]KJY57090.1 Adenylate cyclase family [Lactobacillus melliventris]
MSKNNEIEAKIILPKTIYHKLCQDFAAKSCFKQENYYFDTKDGLLKQNHISCRIRLFADHAEQTLKVPNNDPVQHKFHEAIEINDELKLAEAKAMVKNGSKNLPISFKYSVGDYLNKRFSDHLILNLQTFSKTKRILANGPENCELTFDDSTYPDNYEDFEIEIENTNPQLIAQVLLDLKKKYHFTQNSANTNQAKIARAYKHSAKM